MLPFLYTCAASSLTLIPPRLAILVHKYIRSGTFVAAHIVCCVVPDLLRPLSTPPPMTGSGHRFDSTMSATRPSAKYAS